MHVPQPTKIDSDIMIKSIFYRAPEVFKQKYGKEMDWWAVGVLIYKLLIGKFPFYDSTVNSTRDKILSGTLAFPEPKIYSEEAEDLCR